MGFSGPIKTNNETNHVKEQNLVKNPNWQEADQLAVDKWGQGVELWTTENNICPANHSYMYPFSRFLSFLKKKIHTFNDRKKDASDSEKAGGYTAVCLARRLQSKEINLYISLPK